MIFPFHGSDDTRPIYPHGGATRLANDNDATTNDDSNSIVETDDENNDDTQVTRTRRGIQKPLRYRQ